MNPVVHNLDFVALELRTLAAMTGGIPKGQLALIAGGSPTGRSNVMGREAYAHAIKAGKMVFDLEAIRPRGESLTDFIFPGLKRDELNAPNTTTMRILKERKPEHGSEDFSFVPFTQRIKSGLQ